MAQTIESRGIPMIFVRTHLDEIKDQEEDWHETVKTEHSIFEKALAHTVPYFAVTNIETDIESERLQQLDLFKDYLMSNVAERVAEAYTEATYGRLTPLREQKQKTIESRQTVLQVNAAKNAVQLAESQKKLERMQSQWTRQMQDEGRNILRRNETFVSGLDTSLQSEELRQKRAFAAQIDEMPPTTDSTLLAQAAQKQFGVAMEALNITAQKEIEAATSVATVEVGEKMKGILTDANLEEMGVALDCTFNMDVVNAFAERQKALEEDIERRYMRLRELKENAEAQRQLNEAQRGELEEQLRLCEQAIEERQAAAKSLKDNYQPQYIIHESGWGKLGRKIGGALDTALTFLPTTALKIPKVISSVSKTAGAARTVATVADAAQNSGEGKQNGGFWGFLKGMSLSNLLGSLGEKLDPPTQEIDRTYERRYKNDVAVIERQAHEKRDAKIQLAQRMSAISRNNDLLQRQIAQAEQEAQDAIENDLREALKRNEAQKREALAKSLKEQAKNMFERQTESYRQKLQQKVAVRAGEIFQSILQAATDHINNQLQDVKAQLANLEANKATARQSLANETARLEALKEKLTL